MRITKPVLIEQIKKQNFYLALSPSNYFAVMGERNGYTAIDLCFVDEKGNTSVLRNYEGGTKKECYCSLFQLANNYHNYKYPQKQLNRLQAKTICELNGINFDSDFHALNSNLVELLLVLAKETKYRKPQSANGSLARYFFYNLAKLKGAK